RERCSRLYQIPWPDSRSRCRDQLPTRRMAASFRAGWPVAVRGSSGLAENETEITLRLLTAVERNSGLTQRSAARELGIALGLTNAYLKRCAHKGWIKIQQAPANRYAYYLTPTGFAEKTRLTRDYLTISFNFFRNAR